MSMSKSNPSRSRSPPASTAAIQADSDAEFIDNTSNDADLPDPAFDKAESYFRTYGKTPPVKALQKTEVQALVAPRIRGLGEDGQEGIKLKEEQVFKTVTDCVRASHKMYNTCGCVHGDITNRSVCFAIGDDGEVSGLLLDLDDRLPEDFVRDVKVKEME